MSHKLSLKMFLYRYIFQWFFNKIKFYKRKNAKNCVFEYGTGTGRGEFCLSPGTGTGTRGEVKIIISWSENYFMLWPDPQRFGWTVIRRKLVYIWFRFRQGCGSAFILCGSGSSRFYDCGSRSGSESRSGSGSRSRSSLTKFEEKKSWRVFLSCKNIKDCSKVRNNGACANLLLKT